MKQLIISILLCLCILKPVWADDNNYWQCVAHDSEKKQWMVKNVYEQVASNKAFEACKKESRAPVSCKAPKASCDHFSDGTDSAKQQATSSNAMWQCTALDQKATTWPGSTYSNRDEAALGAKANCRKHSSLPDTCYVNFLTCKNINDSRWI